ncbi:YbaB/EbfC family nucleoid-associated protein [Amycolatopsis sp. 195334CR]|uniref:YbaB/EbfC family nucleoid-associated protein n=1 Tax=Amycolatopsis sp. 195334CR TaxID=2814588 RepID=UPI001A8C52F4|nr:YbaB/EbfC family nucleoid-associated protein [Amycolatopsis sp. 195334CR]MBN6034047.1 YbaB/EbfC family nucleoid-associated protein [Amycolatopsis sp. 195334CR]
MTDPWQASKDVVRHAQDQLDQLRARGGPSASATPPEPPVGVGEAMDGKVRVEITGARVSALHIDPAALRIPAGELATVVMEATNMALDAMRAAMTTSLPSPPSLDQMTRTLNEISSDSFRAMDNATEGIRRSMDAIQRISEQHRER